MRLKTIDVRQDLVEILSNSTKPLSAGELKGAYCELHSINAIPRSSEKHVKDIFTGAIKGLVTKSIVNSIDVKGQRWPSYELVAVGASVDKLLVSSPSNLNYKKCKSINDELDSCRMEIDELQLDEASSVEAINVLLKFIDEYKHDSEIIAGMKVGLRKQKETVAKTRGRLTALQYLAQQLEAKHSFK